MKNSRRLKICIISTIKNPHIIRWYRALLSCGIDVIIITCEPNEQEIADIHVIECISSRSKFYLKNLLFQFKHTLHISSILGKLKPDIVHIHSFDYIHPFMIALTNYCTKKFENLVISTWGTDVIGDQKKSSVNLGLIAKKMLLKQAKEITATSHYLASLTGKMAPRKKNIHIIPFGIDCEQFKKSNESNGNNKFRIGFIKHLTKKYGPEYLLKSVAEIRKNCDNVELIMVGHGEMKDYLRKLAKNLGIENYVKFTGYISNEKIPSILSGLDIFVMPSIIEAFGVSAIEAQAMEVPVVASKVGGIPEVVLDGVTGILVEPKNIKELTSAIKKLIENPLLRKSMGKAGRKFVFENYNIRENVQLFKHLYYKIAERNSASITMYNC